MAQPTATRTPIAPAQNKKTVAGISLLLVIIVWIVFGQTLQYSFVSYDDEKHIVDNPKVNAGLTAHGVAWAFRLRGDDYWHPLDFVSHMLDCQLFGLNAGGHHLTNVVLHSAAAVLLFLVLRDLTGALWRSAFVAAIFAIHPLRVESVAWVMERKGVLSGVFVMLTIGAYARYVRSPFSLWRYLTVNVAFALGLMAKPTIMSLPFVLLLLDYWPLKRVNLPGPATAQLYVRLWSKLLLEKAPLIALAVGSCITAAVGLAPGFESSKNLPHTLQAANAIVSYVTYLWQTVYPAGLAVMIPFPERGLPFAKVLSAFSLLVAISVAVFAMGRNRGYLPVGWLWYLVMSLPIIGFFQSGGIARADRYTYLPQIGLVLLLTWGVCDLMNRWRHRGPILGITAVVSVGLLAWLSWVQTQYWRDSDALWRRTLKVTSGNYFAHEAYGTVLLKRGQLDDSLVQYQAAAQIRPTYSGYQGLGSAFAKRGDLDQATHYLRAALEMQPTDPEAHSNVAAALFRNGQINEAISHWEKVLEARPDNAEAEKNLAAAWQKLGDTDRAILHWERSVQIEPNVEAYNALAIAISQTGRLQDALAQWGKALALDAENLPALYNTAWVLATSPDNRIRNGANALILAERAARKSPDDPRVLRLLAAAYAEQGEFGKAIGSAEKAGQLALEKGNTALADVLRDNTALFRANIPLRDSPATAR